MLPTKFRFIWPSGFRGEDFQKSTNQKQELPVVAMFVNESGRNEQTLQRTFHRYFLSNFSSFGPAVSEKKIFQKSTNQKQEWPLEAMFVNGSGRNEHSLERPSIDASYQVSLHLAKGFQKRRLKCEKLTNDRRQVMMAKAHIAFHKVS